MRAPPQRLAIVVSHPTQYYSPWFRWLAAHTPLQLRVFYLWDFGITEQRDPQFGTRFRWDTDLLSGYDWELVPNRAADPGTHHFGGLRNPSLTRQLGRWRPGSVLLFGYAWAAHLGVIRWARTRGIPLIFRGDSHFLGRPGPGRLKAAALGLLYRQFAAVTFVGAANRRYFQALGIPDQRLFFAPHAVDEPQFGPAAVSADQEAAALRAELDLAPTNRVVLFAGKLVPAKQPFELLQAFLRVSGPQDRLIFVGDGPEKPRLEAEAAAARGRVRFLPFANQSAMPARYRLADVFALPSRGFYETWGLAVNEAMHSGVPCLVSNRVGCQEDLVVPGLTGWVFDAGETDALPQTLRHALHDVADPDARRRLGEAARARALGYTYQQAGAGLLRAVESVA